MRFFPATPVLILQSTIQQLTIDGVLTGHFLWNTRFNHSKISIAKESRDTAGDVEAGFKVIRLVHLSNSVITEQFSHSNLAHQSCEIWLPFNELPCAIPPGCEQCCRITQWQAAGFRLPGPYSQAVVLNGGGDRGPTGGVSGPSSWRLGRLLLSCGPSAGHLLCRWHGQAVEPARLQLPQGWTQLIVSESQHGISQLAGDLVTFFPFSVLFFLDVWGPRRISS